MVYNVYNLRNNLRRCPAKLTMVVDENRKVIRPWSKKIKIEKIKKGVKSEKKNKRSDGKGSWYTV